MTPMRISARLTTTVVAAMLLLGALAGPALAKPPLYGGAAPSSPEYVSYGGLVRFDVSWTNLSGANLPTVYTRATTPAGGDLIEAFGESQGSCDDTGTDLTCSFGTVNAGATVSFAVIYRVGSASPFRVDFIFTAQGDTGSDRPGKSRGDDMPVTGSVPLVPATSDQAGSYIYGDETVVENNPSLNKNRNPQSAKLDFTDSADANFGATVSEAAANGACASGVSTCFGDLTVLKVKNGNPVTGGFFATIGYFQVPGSAIGAFLHWASYDGTGTPTMIDDTCADTSGAAPCIYDTYKVQGNTFNVLYLGQNGSVRAY